MATVTKKELAYRIALKTGQKKILVKRIIQEFINEIVEDLARGNRLEFREFGVFEIKTRAARKARNPRTGVSVNVPSKMVVHFKAGRALKDRVQGVAGPSKPDRRLAGGGGHPLPPAGSEKSLAADEC